MSAIYQTRADSYTGTVVNVSCAFEHDTSCRSQLTRGRSLGFAGVPSGFAAVRSNFAWVCWGSLGFAQTLARPRLLWLWLVLASSRWLSLWLALSSSGWPLLWLALAGSGWLWLALAGSGSRLTLAGSGCLRLALAGTGWLRLALGLGDSNPATPRQNVRQTKCKLLTTHYSCEQKDIGSRSRHKTNSQNNSPGIVCEGRCFG